MKQNESVNKGIGIAIITVTVLLILGVILSLTSKGYSSDSEDEVPATAKNLPAKLYLRMDSEGGKFKVGPGEHTVSSRNGLIVCFRRVLVEDKGVVGNTLIEAGAALFGESVGALAPREHTHLIAFDPKTLEGTYIGAQEGREGVEGKVKLSPHPSGLGYAIVFYQGYGPGAPRHASGTLLRY